MSLGMVYLELDRFSCLTGSLQYTVIEKSRYQLLLTGLHPWNNHSSLFVPFYIYDQTSKHYAALANINITTSLFPLGPVFPQDISSECSGLPRGISTPTRNCLQRRQAKRGMSDKNCVQAEPLWFE